MADHLNIAFATRSVPMHGRTPWERCLGGSESALVFAARALARRGHTVDVYTRCESPGDYDGVEYHDIAELASDQRVRDWDVFISLRFPDLIAGDVRAGLRLLWCQDLVTSAPVPGWLAWCDALVFVSDWHRDTTLAKFPALAGSVEVVPNSIERDLVPPLRGARTNQLLHLSRPERGLRPLLRAWPSIRARAPDADLAVARYRSFHEPAGSQVEAFCIRMDGEVAATAGASHLGNLTKPELYAALSGCRAMVYPAEFDETSCIAAIEAQACGAPVVAVRRGALPETLCPDAAVLVDPGPDLPERFADAVVDLLHDTERQERMSLAGRAWAERFDADVVAARWEAMFVSRFQARREKFALAIRRTLAERGDTGLTGDPPATESASWAISPRLSGQLRAILHGRVVGTGLGLAGDLVGAHLPDFCAAEADMALDIGGVLVAEDPVAWISWVRSIAPNAVYLLPERAKASLASGEARATRTSSPGSERERPSTACWRKRWPGVRQRACGSSRSRQAPGKWETTQNVRSGGHARGRQSAPV